MAIPADFRFSDNPNVNDFATGRAVILFGEGWKTKSGLEITHPLSSGVCIAEKSVRGWELMVFPPAAHSNQHSVSCKKSGSYENPSPNIAARSRFYTNGEVAHISHYSKSHSVNPPDGTPSQVTYREGGGIAGCWYANDDGTIFISNVSATQEEVAERIARARSASAAGLCDGKLEIVALKSSIPPTKSPSKNSSSMSTSLLRA